MLSNVDGAQGGGCIDPSRPGVLRFGDLDVILPGTFTFRFPSLSHEQNRSCKYCGSVTWKEESINCCGNGKFVVHRLKPLASSCDGRFSPVLTTNRISFTATNTTKHCPTTQHNLSIDQFRTFLSTLASPRRALDHAPKRNLVLIY